MDFLDVLRVYFRGERLESLLFILPLGVGSVLFGAALLKAERSGFSWGVAVPFFILGLALVVTGASVGFRTPAQVADLVAFFDRDQAAFAAAEIRRMQGVNANWPVYLATWCTFIGVGLALRFGVARDWALGLGISLVFFGGVGLMIDGFAERRARPYTAALKALQDSAQGRSDR